MWCRSNTRMHNNNLHRIHIRCSMFVMLMAFVFTMLCSPAVTQAQTPDLSEGLRIERLRQAGDIDGLEQLGSDTNDKIAAAYSKWNMARLKARSSNNKDMLQNMLSPWRKNIIWEDHPYTLLLRSLMAETLFYDLWASETDNPSLVMRFGMPDEALAKQVIEQTTGLADQLPIKLASHLNKYPAGSRPTIAQRASYLAALACHLQALAIQHLAPNPAQENKLRQQAINALHVFDDALDDPWQLAESAAWLKVEIQLAQGQHNNIIEPKTATILQAKLARAMLHAAQGQVDQACEALQKEASNKIWQPPQMQLVIADAICRIGTTAHRHDLAMRQYVTLLKHDNPALEQAIRQRLVTIDWLDTPSQLINMDFQTLDTLLWVMLKPISNGQPIDATLGERVAKWLVAMGESNKPFDPQTSQTLRYTTLAAWYHLGFATTDNSMSMIEGCWNSLHSAIQNTNADDRLILESLAPAMLLAQRIQNQDRSLWLRILWQYQELSRILYTRFNTSQLADDYRLFDVVAVRLPAKEYALALQRLADMPANHAQYWVSLRYQLGIYRQLANHPDWPSERIVAAVAPIRDQAVRHLPRATDEQQQTIVQVAIEASGMLWQAAVKNQDWQSAADQLQWLESSHQVDAQTKRTWLTRRLVSLQRAAQWQATNRLANQLLNDDGKASFPVIMQIMEAMQHNLESQTHAVMLGKRDAIDATFLDALSELSQSVVKWAMVNVEDEQQVLLAKLVWAMCLKESGHTRDALALLSPLTGQFGDEPDLLMTIAECHFKLASAANDQQAAKLYHQLISRSLPDAQGQFPSRYWQAWTRYLQICDRTHQHTDVIASRIHSLKAEDPTLGGEPWAVLLKALQDRYAGSQTPIK